MKEAWAFLREVVDEWQHDNALALGAALAYYTIFALAPMLVLVIAIAGLVLGRTEAQYEIVSRVHDEVGPNVAKVIEGMIAQLTSPKSGVVATLTSLVTMVFGATGVFGQLQTALNQIWSAPRRKGGGVRRMLRRRLSAFGLILLIGFLLLLSIVLTAVIAGAHHLLEEYLPSVAGLLPSANLLVSAVLMTLLFAAIYKVLPDVKIRWQDVWLGAGLTAILFLVGKSAIGLYLSRASVASVYGAAGSLVVLLLWIYFSAQIFFLGAEFTEVYSRRYGSRQGRERGEDASAGA